MVAQTRWDSWLRMVAGGPIDQKGGHLSEDGGWWSHRSEGGTAESGSWLVAPKTRRWDFSVRMVAGVPIDQKVGQLSEDVGWWSHRPEVGAAE